MFIGTGKVITSVLHGDEGVVPIGTQLFVYYNETPSGMNKARKRFYYLSENMNGFNELHNYGPYTEMELRLRVDFKPSEIFKLL